MKKLFLFAILISFLSCAKSDENKSLNSDCPENNNNFKPYDGEEIECQFYYVLTKYEGEEYLELRSRCADLTRNHVFNEACEDICKDNPYDQNSLCGMYLDGRTEIGVHLIEK